MSASEHVRLGKLGYGHPVYSSSPGIKVKHLNWSASPRALALAAACVFGAETAHAGGFAAQEISARGLGRANSGEAAQAGVDSLWWNPAAIARSGREVYVGALGRWNAADFTDDGSTVTRPIPPAGLTTPVGGDADPSDALDDFTAFNGAVAIPLGDRLAAGLSVTRPFFVKSDFGADGWTRYDTIRNKIEITDVQATVAVVATDWLDLGLGVSAEYMDAYLDSASPNLAPGSPDAIQALSGDGWDFGWTVGAQVHAEQVSLGLSYRSAIDHKIEGDLSLTGLQAPLDAANFAAPATTRFSTPWTVTAAVQWRITPQLTLNAQVQRAGWSEYDVIDVAFAGQSVGIAQNFSDTTSVAVGFDYALNDRWTIRGGLGSDETPTPDSLREPGVADSDRWVYAVGATVTLSEAVSIDGALAFTRFEGSRIFEDALFYGGTPAQTTAALRGDFDGDAVSAALALRIGF